MTRSAFHAGERALHARLGTTDRVEAMAARMVRSFMPEEHRAFFETLPFLVLGGADTSDDVWATIVSGPPGFATSPDARTLVVAPGALPGDPLVPSLVAGAKIGVLGIEPRTRRRNRMNGTVRAAVDGALEVGVDQSFGNCPKHIVPRDARFAPERARPDARVGEEGPRLSAASLELVRRADTFFIATATPEEGDDPREGADVSHRGGPPGFVTTLDDGGRTLLRAPDYRGNDMLSTFGNIERRARAGALFLDFVSGVVLLLTCDARVCSETPGREEPRTLELRVRRGLRLEGGLPLDFEAVTRAGHVAPG